MKRNNNYLDWTAVDQSQHYQQKIERLQYNNDFSLEVISDLLDEQEQSRKQTVRVMIVLLIISLSGVMLFIPFLSLLWIAFGFAIIYNTWRDDQ